MSQGVHFTAVTSLVIAGLSALAILVDILSGRRQPMKIMNVVWPITGLYAGPLAVWFYYRTGRAAGSPHGHRTEMRGDPSRQSVALSTLHCGGGCTLGDICAEWIIYFFPFTLFHRAVYTAWTLDFALAFLFGIAFQYGSIKPMRQVSSREALVAALKADTLSLIAWQIGMYAWMAFAIFVVFRHEPKPTDPLFWFMMQWAMLAGFIISYPINRWLIRRGIKDAM